MLFVAAAFTAFGFGHVDPRQFAHTDRLVRLRGRRSACGRVRIGGGIRDAALACSLRNKSRGRHDRDVRIFRARYPFRILRTRRGRILYTFEAVTMLRALVVLFSAIAQHASFSGLLGLTVEGFAACMLVSVIALGLSRKLQMGFFHGVVALSLLSGDRRALPFERARQHPSVRCIDAFRFRFRARPGT